MRSALLIALALGSALTTSGGTTAFAQAIAVRATGVESAPIGHLQPRAKSFSYSSAAEQAEQQRMSNFDGEQQKLDEELDKRLNICRC